MVDLLVAWGVTQAVGFVFKPILEDLAKDSAKDWAKDLFKDSLKNVIRLPTKEPLDIAAGKALKEFLQLVQDELEDAELSEEQLKNYIKPLKQFIKDKSVKEILGSAFKDDCQAVDTKTLTKIWYQLNLLSLPDEFSWERVAKKYLKKVKAIVRESDELRSILDSQNIEAIQQNTKELAGIVPEFDLRRYQEGLQERYGNLNLDSLDTTVYDYRERLKVWQIFIAQNVRECQEFLPQVYEIPKEHQKRLRESNELEAEVDPEEWERYKQVYYQQPIRSVLDVVNDPQNYPYAVILGDPGSGKSTLLQYIALNWARSPLNNVISQPIPLLIELRSYKRDRISGQCKDFLEFFHKGNVICRLNQHQLNERLKAGKVLVMFDGLDEVFEPTQREEVITDIHRFTNEYPNVRVIVTSRIIGYKPRQLKDAEFRHFLLQDLESDQIQDFIYRWHELTFTDEADKVRKRERLQQAIKISKAIGELAGNPLLLTMMAILNRNQELPRDRPELYNQASRVLLHQWDVEQKLLENPRIDSVAIDYKDKQAMLRQVAYHMQAADQGLAGNLIRGDDLEKILTGYLKSIEVSQARTVARLLIEQLRSRNFILCFMGADSYAFVHRTFLEYFCACEFVERFGKRGLGGGLTLEQLKTEVFGKHWQDESWHEVLRLITGMIDTSFAGEIIEYLMALDGEAEDFINLFLATELLSEVRNRRVIQRTDIRLFNNLKELYENLKNQIDVIDSKRISSTREEYDLSDKICIKVVSAVASTWSDDSDTLLWLKTCIQSNKGIYTRAKAVQELARSWKDHPETLQWLKAYAQQPTISWWLVQQTVVQEIARGWKDDPETLQWLKTWVQADGNKSDRFTQAAAVEELVNGWKDDPETLLMLKTCIQSDDRSDVARRTALEELAKGWKDDPDTLPLLKTCAQSDKAWFVREGALAELAEAWKDDPEVLPIFKTRVQSDKYWRVRATALEDLARSWKDDQDTLPMLKAHALSDNNWRVRRVAVQELARGWKDEPWIFEFLCDRALNDPFERKEDWEDNPRQTALEAIIKQRPDSPLTLSLLRDRAENDPDEKVREFAKEKLAELEV